VSLPLTYPAAEARSAEDAIAILERDCNFQILLTDVHMTGPLNGLDLARFSKGRCPHIKVAVMCGLHRPNADE
jgi:two-component system, response regulator PdtaR